MCSAMNIGVLVSIKLGNTFDYGIRFLGRCSVIQPNERPTMYSLFKNGKVAPDELRIEWTLTDSELGRRKIRPELERLDS